MQRYECTLARNAREIAEVQRLRWRVYGEEEKLLPARMCVEGREIDVRDADLGRVSHFIVRAGEEVVGTVRLTQAAPGDQLELDLEAKLDLAVFCQPGMVPAEITRFCVLAAYRGTGVTPALFAALRDESERRGITHWLAAANTETDVAEDAAIAHRIASTRDLVSARFRVDARAPLVPEGKRSPRRPGYTEPQRLQARAGALAGLDLPRTLSLFARRMGARFMGAPFYDDYFNVFALPLVVALGETTRDWTSTTYPVSPTGANAARRPPPSPGGGSS